MEVGEKNIQYRYNWLKAIIKNGLLWQGLRNQLAKIGIDIMPYYWEIGTTLINEPKLRDDPSLYEISVFGEKELIYAKNNIIGIEHKNLLKDLNEGETCLGIKKNGDISIYTFIKHKDFKFRHRQFKIRPNEGYVHNTYTFERYRGLNLAPYLRYHCYQFFKEKGITTYYSISEYFNKPTLRYKQKLQVKPLKLYLSIILFKKWNFNYTLKTYEVK